MIQTQSAPLVTAHPEHQTTLTSCLCGDFTHRALPRYSTADKRRCKHIFKLEQELAYYETTLSDEYQRPYCGCPDYIQHEADSCFHLDMLRQHARPARQVQTAAPASRQAAHPTMGTVAQLAQAGASEEDLWACFELV